VNYLLLLSWAPGGDQEVIDINEAIKLFDITNVNKTAATFDLKKLDWMNNQYLKNADSEKLTDQLIPMLVEAGLIDKDNFDRAYVLSLVKLFQPRLAHVNDFVDWADFFFLKDVKMDPAAQAKCLSKDLSKEFALFVQRLDTLRDFTVENIEKCFRDMMVELGLEAKVLIHPIRVALTGKTIGPGLFEVIYYLGKGRSKERLQKWIK